MSDKFVSQDADGNSISITPNEDGEILIELDYYRCQNKFLLYNLSIHEFKYIGDMFLQVYEKMKQNIVK